MNTNRMVIMYELLQLVLITAQKRAALGECDARHKEILELEQNIGVRYSTNSSL